MEEKEKIIAVIGGEQSPKEVELANEMGQTSNSAKNIVIVTAEDYASVAEFAKEIKNKAKEVTEFFKPLKETAHKAHTAICEREKACLAPLKEAEATIKKAMGAYLEEEEKKRKEAEEMAQKALREEAERKFAEAQKAEQNGDAKGSEQALKEAMFNESMAKNIVVGESKPSVQGVSTSVDWEIVSVDAEKVPVFLNGMELRPVDLKAVKALIKASKGKIKIDGIEYKEVPKISIRSGK